MCDYIFIVFHFNVNEVQTNPLFKHIIRNMTGNNCLSYTPYKSEYIEKPTQISERVSTYKNLSKVEEYMER